MSDEPTQTRETIIRLDGRSVEQEGVACVLLYWFGPQIEIVAIEADGGDVSVLLSKDQARSLVQALEAALDERSSR
jgi:hypothetical protein